MFGKMVAFLVAGLMLVGAASAQTISREAYQKQLDDERLQLSAMSRDADPTGWAKAQADFGMRLYLFDSLDEAILAYRAALEVYSNVATPKEWAKTQELVGLAFQKRASMKGVVGLFLAFGRSSDPPDPKPDLFDALEAFSAAEQIYTENAFPDDWARLQLMKGNCESHLASVAPDDGPGVSAHRDAAAAAFSNVLRVVDEASDPLTRGFAHRGLAALNEHGFVDDVDRIGFALEHAKRAKGDFTAAGEMQLAADQDRMISSLEYDLESAESYVPDEGDAVFGTRRN